MDKKSKTFCVLPWVHLVIHPSGGASLCCRSKHDNAQSWAKDSNGMLLTVNTCKIADIYNSDKFIEVRNKMQLDKKPEECEGCWADEKEGIESKRQYENNRWKHTFSDLNCDADIKNNVQYRYIELRLGNVCNNACITCNANSSSKWKNIESQIANTIPWFTCIVPENCEWINNACFYDDLLQHSNKVEEIYINGGEPTLIKSHYRYLEELVNQGTAKKIKLVYSLNMTSIPHELIELWKQFKEVVVNASIDDVKERNYYIRYPTKWQSVTNSMSILEELKNVSWNVTQTVSILNVGNLGDLHTFLKEKYNKTPHHNYVLYPDYLSLAALPNYYKTELVKKYNGVLPTHQYDTLVNKLNIKHDPELLTRAKEFVAAVDLQRNSSVFVYIPETRKFLQ